jgi:hypothetical protein
MEKNPPTTEPADVADGTSGTTTVAEAPQAPAAPKPAKAKVEAAGAAPAEPKTSASSRDGRGRFAGKQDDSTGGVLDEVDDADDQDDQDIDDADDGDKDTHPLAGVDYEEVMRRFRGEEKPEPKAKKKAESVEELDDLDEFDEDEYEEPAPRAKVKPKGDLAARIQKVAEEVDPEVASLLEELHNEIKGFTSQAKQQTQAQYEVRVHKAFDQFGEEIGAAKIYGNTAKKLTQEQITARRLVHDTAVDLLKRLRGQKIGGKVFDEMDAFQAAHQTVFSQSNKYTPTEVDQFRSRHAARRPIGKGSNAGEYEIPEDPDDVDGTSPPKKRR